MWVVNELVGMMGQGRTAVKVLTREGEPAGEYLVNLPAANNALELLGRHQGMFIDRQQVAVKQVVRWTIGKGYDEPEPPGQGSGVVNRHVVDEIPHRVGAE